ncbi:hypothetical protein BDD12DRAFT_851371 [Trichophaea hybrida]|nr:hypothetical protein BDD12DRAFT_851371 [Trichophaea hybrida]
MGSLSALPLEILYEIIEILYSLNKLKPISSVAPLRLVNNHLALIARPFLYREFSGSIKRIRNFLRRLHREPELGNYTLSARFVSNPYEDEGYYRHYSNGKLEMDMACWEAATRQLGIPKSHVLHNPLEDDRMITSTLYSEVCAILLLLKLPKLKSLAVDTRWNDALLMDKSDVWTLTVSPVLALESLSFFDGNGYVYWIRQPKCERVDISSYLSILKSASKLTHFKGHHCIGEFQDNCDGGRPNLRVSQMRDIIGTIDCNKFTSLEFTNADIDSKFFVWLFGFTKHLRKFTYEFLRKDPDSQFELGLYSCALRKVRMTLEELRIIFSAGNMFCEPGFHETLHSFEDFPRMTTLMTEYKFLANLDDALPGGLEHFAIINSEWQNEDTCRFLEALIFMVETYAGGSKLKELVVHRVCGFNGPSEYEEELAMDLEECCSEIGLRLTMGTHQEAYM